MKISNLLILMPCGLVPVFQM